MSYNLYFNYRKRFGCSISYVDLLRADILILPAGKMYSLKGLTDEQIDILMQKSLDKSRNVLLEKVKDKELKTCNNGISYEKKEDK